MAKAGLWREFRRQRAATKRVGVWFPASVAAHTCGQTGTVTEHVQLGMGHYKGSCQPPLAIHHARRVPETRYKWALGGLPYY